MDISLMNLEDLAQQIRTSTIDIQPEALAERLDQINIEYHVGMIKAHYEEKREPPQVHYRVNVQGQKRVPDATFTLEGDDRDIDVQEFWQRHDEFQREVDRRYPLEQQPPMVELPPAVDQPI